MSIPGRPILLALAALLLAPSLAAAHFILHQPTNWRYQGPLGDPQKVGPCGEEGDAAETGQVTAYAPGGALTITLDETIYHPGHYRVALAVNDRSELPAEPPVTPGVTPCGSVPIMNPPVFPILADGALPHATPIPGTRLIQVTLPSDVTCTHCTLQVLEFMSDHSAPCFYHHCAVISIGAGTATPCTLDTECDDGNPCTANRCDLETERCTYGAPGSSACDDGDACTVDGCTPADGCIRQPMTLADVTGGFLGTVEVEACGSDHVPPAIGTLFGKAGRLVTRATATPAKAPRFLARAAKKLRGAGKRLTRASGRRISSGCGAALGTVLGQAQTRVDCLLDRAREALHNSHAGVGGEWWRERRGGEGAGCRRFRAPGGEWGVRVLCEHEPAPGSLASAPLPPPLAERGARIAQSFPS